MLLEFLDLVTVANINTFVVNHNNIMQALDTDISREFYKMLFKERWYWVFYEWDSDIH